MKGKLFLALILAALSLTACGSEGSEPVRQQSESPSVEQSSSVPDTEAQTSSADYSETAADPSAASGPETTADVEKTSLEIPEAFSGADIGALGDVKVEKGTEDVELTIPKAFINESTQVDLDALSKEYGLGSITLNEDGSATYKMTKEQHEKFMGQYREEFNASLKEMIGSEHYPNFTDITANEDYTEFTITTKSKELDLNESVSSMVFYLYGGMYNIFNGTPVDNVSVTFVNADSGEVIYTSDSSSSGS